MGSCVCQFCCLVVLGCTVAPATAQEFDPSRWYPLEVGNRWHLTTDYWDTAIRSDWVEEVIKDTLVRGERWFLVGQTFCFYGPKCSNSGRLGFVNRRQNWRRFSDDFFLLAQDRLFSSEVDTLHATRDRSVFAAQSFPDTLETRAGQFPQHVRLGSFPPGDSADSTDIMLVVGPLDTHWMSEYVYNLGPSHLLGAIVDGREWGDTDGIKAVDRAHPDTLDPLGYFPLAEGNTWVYRHEMHRPASAIRSTDESEVRRERLQVVGNRGDGIFELEHTEMNEEGSALAVDTLEVRFDEVWGGIRSSPGQRLLFQLRCLDAPFYHGPGATCATWVREESVSYPQLFGGDVVTAKIYAEFSVLSQIVHGVGLVYHGPGCEPCGPLSDRDDWYLEYASVSGEVFGTSISSARLPSRADFDLYPNPTSGWLRVDAPPGVPFEVFDLLGRLVLKSGPADFLDLSQLPAGVYAVRGGRTVRTVVKR